MSDEKMTRVEEIKRFVADFEKSPGFVNAHTFFLPMLKEVIAIHEARDEEVRRVVEQRNALVSDNKRLREALEKTKAFLCRCDCECDEYNGFRCGIHDARETVDRALAQKAGGR